jgi:hypothetical protein
MMRRNALGRAALVFFYGGVAPLEPVESPCEKAAFHSAPATEREWLAVTFDVEDLRIRRRGDEIRIEVHDAKWDADGLWAVSRPHWKSGHAISDSLTIPWSEIGLIEKPAGRRTALGAGLGAVVGLGVGIGLGAAVEHDCTGAPGCGYGYFILPLVTVPAGAVIGAIAGSTAHKWVPFFCAPSPSRSSSTRPAEPRE